MSNSAPLLMVVMGPTASGKSDLAELVAENIGAHLLNADAFQVYRYMDIGTAKPARKENYALLDLKEPNEEFGVGEWLRLAEAELWDIYRQGRSAVLVGGTGFYVRALTEGYAELAPAPDPHLRRAIQARLAEEGLDALVHELTQESPAIAATLDLKNPVRVTRALEKLKSPSEPIRVSIPDFRVRKVAIVPSKDQSGVRIQHRTAKMMQNGWIEEVEQLMSLGFTNTDPGFRAIGYREIWSYLKGEISLEICQDLIIQSTVRYAKRQRTWLNKEPRLTTFSEVPSLAEALGCAGP